MRHALTFIVVCAVFSGMLMAQADEDQATEPQSYDNAKVVRIKAVEGEAFVERSYEEGSEEATVNLPLFENDRINTTDGRLEIYLGRTNHLRLDSDTRIQLLQVPVLRRTDLTLKIERGGVYLDVASLDNEKAVEIRTPDCGIFILDQGIYRINVLERGRTEVFVLEGLAEVAGENSSRNLRENQKTVMSGGSVVERPYYFSASEKDDFDQWNLERTRELGNARYGSSRYLDRGYEDYEYELTRNGRWTYMNEFNCNVWIPYNLSSDWRPYWNGRWVWNPQYGYVWTSYDPWGWFTHHYGRWHWDDSRQWYWIPSYHWSGAWVNWFWDNDYYGWCPLSRWNRPVIVIGNHWDHNYNHHDGIPVHSRSTIVIRRNELAAPNMSRAAITKIGLNQDSARRIAFHGDAPAAKPDNAKVAILNRNGERMTIKYNGLVSPDRDQTMRSETTASNDGITFRSRSTVISSGKYSGSDSATGPIRARRDRGSSDSSGSAYGSKGRTSTSSGTSGTTATTNSGGEKAKKKDKGDGSPSWSPSADEPPAATSSAANNGYRSYRGKYSQAARENGSETTPGYQGYRPTTRYPRSTTRDDGADSGDIMPPYSFRSNSTVERNYSNNAYEKPSGGGYVRSKRYESTHDSSAIQTSPSSSRSGYSRSGGSASTGSTHSSGSSRSSPSSATRGSSATHSSSSGTSGGSARKRD